jgi:hypothetical protein
MTRPLTTMSPLTAPATRRPVPIDQEVAAKRDDRQIEREQQHNGEQVLFDLHRGVSRESPIALIEDLLIGRIVGGVPQPTADPGRQHQPRHDEADDPDTSIAARVEADRFDENPDRRENAQSPERRMDEQQNLPRHSKRLPLRGHCKASLPIEAPVYRRNASLP